MKVFLCSLLLAFSAFAAESHFLVNQTRSKASLEAEYVSSNANVVLPGTRFSRRSAEDSNALQLSYSYPYSETLIFNVNTRILDRQFHSQTYSQSHRVSGFSDLNFGLKSGTVYEELTLTYGAEMQLSPAAAKIPYTSQLGTNDPVYDQYGNQMSSDDFVGNNFSGIQMLTPYLGIESYFDQVALGGRLSPMFYSTQALMENGDENAQALDSGTAVRAEGFTEFPLLPKANIGFAAGVGRSLVSPELGEEFMATVYGNYRYDKATAVTLTLRSESLRFPMQVQNNEFSLGLRRSL